MTSTACSCPKSQLGIISLTLFWVTKNFLCTFFLSPDSACMSHRGEEVVEEGMQYTVQFHFWYPSSQSNHKALQTPRPYTHLSKVTSHLSAMHQVKCLFTVTPSNVLLMLETKGLHSQWPAVSLGVKSISPCFWPPILLFLSLHVIFYLNRQDLNFGQCT